MCFIKGFILVTFGVFLVSSSSVVYVLWLNFKMVSVCYVTSVVVPVAACVRLCQNREDVS